MILLEETPIEAEVPEIGSGAWRGCGSCVATARSSAPARA